MKILCRVIIVYSLCLLLADTLYINEYNEEIVKFIINVQKQYESSSVIIAMSEIFNDLSPKAELSVKLSKYFSRKNVFSMFTAVANLSESIEYYKKTLIYPLYVVFLESSDDFNHLVGVTNNESSKALATMLIFSSSNKTLMEICKNPKHNYFNLAFHSNMLVVCLDEDVPIREWYSLFFDKVETYDYATWTYKKGLQLLGSKNMYERRNSLHGINLRVTYVKNEVDERNGTLRGYFGEFLKIMSELADFTYELQEPEDAYGIYDEKTKQWNGVVGQLVNNKTDIGLGDFTITTKRLNDIDFAIPLKSLPCCYFVKKLDRVLPKSIYYKAFGRRASYALASIFFLAPFVITYMIHKHNEARYYKRDMWRVVKILHENFILVWGILCKMPLTKMTKISSLRLAYLSLYILSFLLSAVYCANLTSYLTNLKSDLPFYSVDDFIRDGTYKLIVVEGSSMTEQIKDPKDEKFSKLREKKMLLDKKFFPKTTQTAMQQLCNDEKIALFDDTYCKNPEQAAAPCRIVPFDESHLTSVSIAFVKNSPYVEFFNFCIQKLQSSGLLQRINERNSRKYTAKPSNYHAISLQSATLILSILMTGFCSSIVVFIIEKIFFHFFPTPQHDFAISRTNYWTPLIRPPNKDKKKCKINLKTK